MSALEALPQLGQAVPPPLPPTASEDDVNLLARLIFAEGANHHDRPGAMEGIGWTVANRVGAPGFRKTLKEVIYQPGQFAGRFNDLWAEAADPKTLTGPNQIAYGKARAVAEGVLERRIPDPTGGAQFFYSSHDGNAPGTWFPGEISATRLIPSLEEPIGRFYFLKPNPSPPARR